MRKHQFTESVQITYVLLLKCFVFYHNYCKVKKIMIEDKQEMYTLLKRFQITATCI